MENRELDALVAEHVMGWTVTRFQDTDVIKADTGYDIRDIGYYGFSPSTRIDDAWEVVEEVKKYGLYKLTQLPTFWLADIQTAEKKYWAEADTVELAICLCALKACGIEMQDNE